MGAWGRAVAEPRHPELADRAGYAQAALAAHAAAGGLEDEAPVDAVVHLLCDLMHHSLDLGVDFTALVRSAGQHFCEERLRAAAAPGVGVPAPGRT